MSAGQVLKPSCFEGDGDVRGWIRLYERYASLLGWGEAEKSQGLPLFLRNDAQVWYQGLDEAKTRTWKELLRQLYKRYDAPESKWITARELGQKRLQPGKTVESFGDEVRRRQRELELSDPVALSYFINGLPKNVQRIVSQAMPKDFEQAQQLARNAVKLNQMEDSGLRLIKEDNSEMDALKKDVSDLVRQMAELSRLVESATMAPPMRRNQRGEMQCFGCGRTGHIRRNCPAAGSGANGASRPSR